MCGKAHTLHYRKTIFLITTTTMVWREFWFEDITLSVAPIANAIFYCPRMMLREGNVFIHVCLSTGRGSHVTITDIIGYFIGLKRVVCKKNKNSNNIRCKRFNPYKAKNEYPKTWKTQKNLKNWNFEILWVFFRLGSI